MAVAVAAVLDTVPDTVAVEIRVRGRVQGVGFRPSVWRLARELGLDGEVLNDGDGVLIRVRGSDADIETLVDRLQSAPPPLARIDRIERCALTVPISVGFHIAESAAGMPHTEIAPDAVICSACATEILSPGERRYRYAFTNCTHCGPRLSIVHGIPYDRGQTTMAAFPLCAACSTEYRDPADRRFHAEAIACPVCGPRLVLLRLDNGAAVAGDPIETTVRLIKAGEIVAIKGIGGYQLACDATNNETVARLRRLKQRDRKPFALMARDIATIRRYCAVGAEEEQVLTSVAAPIVLLQAAGPERLPEMVAPGLATIGFMLPTTPLHLLLLRALDRPAVMTSGNLSDEPQVTDDAEMPARLGGIAAYALTHDRAIANRIDDSVVRVVGGKARVLRRARGYAPAPIALPAGFADAPDILAVGGELKATFCLVKDGQAILSQHQGDLEHPAAFDDYRKNLGLYRELFRHEPAALAADMHPEYLSGKLARDWARNAGLRLIEVQHHHAHLAACLAENGWALDASPVLGIVMDGLGWGDDGTIWGGEFLLGNYRGYRRLAGLAPVAMPGGASAVREPWRNLYAQLMRAMDWDEVTERFGGLDCIAKLTEKPRSTLDRIIAGQVNSPPASSCGRLFDAVAAALGICAERQAYEGEAAMRLEALVDADSIRRENGYRFELGHGVRSRNHPVAGLDRATHLFRGDEGVGPQDVDARDKPGQGEPYWVIEPGPIWQQLLGDIGKEIALGLIAARFHKGLAESVAAMAERLAQSHCFGTVALSGGCFQNVVLFTLVSELLEGRGFRVLNHAAVPANDGGLALGQAAVAAARLIAGDA